MEKHIVITEETVRHALSYVPVFTKETFVEHCAPGCLDTVRCSLGESADLAMPNMYKENTFKRSRYMMTAFVVFYLGTPLKEVPSEDGDDWLMTQDEYDKWASSHVFNQLERMKGKADLRDKVFDMLRDFRDLEKRLSTGIYSMLNVMNDVTNRIFLKVQQDTSAEALEEQRKTLNDLVEEFNRMKEEKEKQENLGKE